MKLTLSKIITEGSIADKLSAKAQFYDVEGIPVSFNEPLAGMLCAAWDIDPPRKFNSESMYRNGAPILREEFAEMIETQEWVRLLRIKKKYEPYSLTELILLCASVLMGLAIFVFTNISFSVLGDLIDVPTSLDFGASKFISFGGGVMSYDEERSGIMTSYGVFSLLIAAMLGVRSGICLFKLKLDGGYSRADNMEFLAWLLGACLATVVGGLLYHLFKSFSGWFFSALHFVIEASALWGIWLVIRKWVRDA